MQQPVVRLGELGLQHHREVRIVDVVDDDVVVRRRDHVDVTRLERLGSHLRVDDHPELDLVEIGQLVAVLVGAPVVGVLGDDQAVAGRVALEQERACAHGVGRLRRARIDCGEPCRRGDEAGLTVEVDRERRPRDRLLGVAVETGEQREREVVDLFEEELRVGRIGARIGDVASDVLHRGADEEAAEAPVEVVHHGVGVEWRSVMERDAFAHLDRERGRVLVGRDALGEVRRDVQLVVDGEQRVVERGNAHLAV